MLIETCTNRLYQLPGFLCFNLAGFNCSYSEVLQGKTVYDIFDIYDRDPNPNYLPNVNFNRFNDYNVKAKIFYCGDDKSGYNRERNDFLDTGYNGTHTDGIKSRIRKLGFRSATLNEFIAYIHHNNYSPFVRNLEYVYQKNGVARIPLYETSNNGLIRIEYKGDNDRVYTECILAIKL